jgi:hypothetical protein
MIVEFKNLLQNSLGKNYILMTTALFDYPTIAALAEYIEKLLFPTEEKKPEAKPEKILPKKEEPITKAIPSEMTEEEIAKQIHEMLEKLEKE